MPIDFESITSEQENDRNIDPIDLFHSLKIQDANINDLWLAQGDALREWHNNREENDSVILLNTGAGKTLVGLLMSQSLVNETKGQVLYACSSIQLVEQTRDKARGYGLDVTTYFQQEFNNDLYFRCLAPCITTYQALFNGKSKFFDHDIEAIVFDDAHTVENLLRDHFTLNIDRAEFPDLFGQIAQRFNRYFDETGEIVGYTETIENQNYNQWLVPPFVIKQQISELQRLLIDANLDRSTSTLFSWEHIKNHIDLCAFLVSGNQISITPPFLPINTLPYFDDNIRRIYLSATLSAKDSFIRTFGKIPENTIAPTTTAGECERLIIVPSLNENCEDDVDTAKEILSTHKGLILVPSYNRRSTWEDVITDYSTDNVSEQLDLFKQSTNVEILALVSRYDGIDLPDDTCRVMVIDGLPLGVGPLERFLWEKLGLMKSLSSTIASRIVQSFGRISRGLSDYGVVVLTNENLIKWLQIPKNRKLLPPFLKAQLELGFNVSRSVSSLDDLIDSVDQCLERDERWVDYYQNIMSDEGENRNITEDNDLIKIAEMEVEFINNLWNRDYTEAASIFQENLNETFQISKNSGAWHSLWLGYSYELMEDHENAIELYIRSHSASVNIPRYNMKEAKFDRDIPEQIQKIVELIIHESNSTLHIPTLLEPSLAALNGEGTVAQTEEALRNLGEFLGADSSRPDNEFGTGPDVLWEFNESIAYCIEAKTDMSDETCYRKRYIGQMHDHIEWVSSNSNCDTIIPIFIGPTNPACPRTNPSRDMVVIELEELNRVGNLLISTLKDICNHSIPKTLQENVLEYFGDNQLLYDQLYDSLHKEILMDIR